MKPRSGTRHAQSQPLQEKSPVDIRESGIVPARARGARETLTPAVTLRPARDDLSAFGASVVGASDILIVGSRHEEARPFATLYRITEEGVVRERVLRGAAGHDGPSLSTDGERIAVGQPARTSGTGFVTVYRRRGAELELETTLEPAPDDASATRFGELVGLSHELLALGQAASVCVYRHSAVGWLSAGSLRPSLPYEWNPSFGKSLGVLGGRVLVGNPVELEGHRAGAGRVFVYRQDDDHMELECELQGDGIESGREEQPRSGFGHCIQVNGEFALITAPHELSASGTEHSVVYVYRVQAGALRRFARLEVPGCHGGACLNGERLVVLGDALFVFTRTAQGFEPVATYSIPDASQLTMASCGKLLALASPQAGGQVALHFADQL